MFKKETESIVLNKISQILYGELYREFMPLYIARRQLAELQSRFDHRYTGNMSLDEIAKMLANEMNINDVRTLEREADLAADCLKLDARMGQIYKSAAASGKKIALIAECAYDQAWMEMVIKKLDLPSADYYFTTSQTSGLCSDGSIWPAVLMETGVQIGTYCISVKTSIQIIYCHIIRRSGQFTCLTIRLLQFRLCSSA